MKVLSFCLTKWKKKSLLGYSESFICPTTSLSLHVQFVCIFVRKETFETTCGRGCQDITPASPSASEHWQRQGTRAPASTVPDPRLSVPSEVSELLQWETVIPIGKGGRAWRLTWSHGGVVVMPRDLCQRG